MPRGRGTRAASATRPSGSGPGTGATAPPPPPPGEEVADGAAGRSHRHPDVPLARLDRNVADKPQVHDVHGDFGVVDLLQRLEDLLLSRAHAALPPPPR